VACVIFEDMLAWFSEEERNECASCGERACVSLEGAIASFCLACGAVTIDGVRIDRDRKLPDVA
jgi:hypothetical protein